MSMSFSLRHLALATGAGTLAAIAQRVGAPTRPISLRALFSQFATPLQAADLHLTWLEGGTPQHPVNHPPDATGVPLDATLNWSDPGKGSWRAAKSWLLRFQRGNQPSEQVVGFNSAGFPLGYTTMYLWSVVPMNEFGSGAASPTFAFKTQDAPGPAPGPAPAPGPIPPAQVPVLSKLSLFNCQEERHTIHVWVREWVAPSGPWGPWGLIQTMPTQYNDEGMCPFGPDGVLADAAAILTKKGEEGGFHCTNGDIYQVSIVDPDRPTCGGINDPDVGNCVVEDRPSFFRFDPDGDEVTMQLENGQIHAVPV